jgi:hypothetical protein
MDHIGLLKESKASLLVGDKGSKFKLSESSRHGRVGSSQYPEAQKNEDNVMACAYTSKLFFFFALDRWPIYDGGEREKWNTKI